MSPPANAEKRPSPATVSPWDKRRQSSKARFQQAVSKVSTQSRVSRLFQSAVESKLADDFGCNVIGHVLGLAPEDRHAKDVERAVIAWSDGLRLSGRALAPDIRADPKILKEAFQRGKLMVCVRDRLLQEEGEEVKNFCIVLHGSCKSVTESLRGNKLTDREGIEDNGLIQIGQVSAGESFGLLPSDRSPFSVVSLEKTMLLQLGVHAYEGTFKRHHRDFFKQTSSFFREHRLCMDDCTKNQLARLAQSMRLRTYPPGTTLFESGDRQRHIWFLCDGECTISVNDCPVSPTGVVPLDAAEELHEVDLDDRLLFKRLRNLVLDAPDAPWACEESRRAALSELARGPMKTTLQGEKQRSSKGGMVGSGELFRVISVRKPGFVLGEEIFLHNNPAAWSNARYYYTVQTVEQSSMYVADITSFQHLVRILQFSDHLRLLHEKLDTRFALATRGKTVVREMERDRSELLSQERAHLEWRKVYLPRCVGLPEVGEVPIDDDFLSFVSGHREAPCDYANLPTLLCLEGTVYGPRHSNNGPVTSKMLAAKQSNISSNSSSMPHSEEAVHKSSRKDNNPLGQSVPSIARYANVYPAGSLGSSDDATMRPGTGGSASQFVRPSSVSSSASFGSRSSSQLHSSGSTCLPHVASSSAGQSEERPYSRQVAEERSCVRQVQIAEEEVLDMTQSGHMPPCLSPEQPKSRRTSEEFDAVAKSQGECIQGEHEKPTIDVEQSALSRAPQGTSQFRVKRDAKLSASVSSPTLPTTQDSPGTDGECQCTGLAKSSSSRSLFKKRHQSLKRAFAKSVTGKSVLALTDNAEVRKVCTRVLFSDDVQLQFVKNPNELLLKFRDPKEHYRVLLLDLSKKGLQAERVLELVRHDEAYASIQIIVLSAERELPECVQQCCSFVVYLPVSRAVLMEALIRCLDHRCAEKLFG